jgi:putative Mg2+ transporter-C (MgtC) family protein
MNVALHAGDLLLRLASAVLLSGLLGWERERRDKPAGIRTHMLVGLGAATFMELAVRLDGSEPTIDPTRVIQGIVGGIGFLCAGSIIQSRGHVHGITTAASVWVAGGIGTACGLANYIAAFAAALISFTVLYFVPHAPDSAHSPMTRDTSEDASTKSHADPGTSDKSEAAPTQRSSSKTSRD